jgi:hypothetical protein
MKTTDTVNHSSRATRVLRGRAAALAFGLNYILTYMQTVSGSSIVAPAPDVKSEFSHPGDQPEDPADVGAPEDLSGHREPA